MTASNNSRTRCIIAPGLPRLQASMSSNGAHFGLFPPPCRLGINYCRLMQKEQSEFAGHDASFAKTLLKMQSTASCGVSRRRRRCAPERVVRRSSIVASYFCYR